MGVIAKEEINPAVPDKSRVLVLLGRGGKNWYLRLRQQGRYRNISLETPDLTAARRKAFMNPPEPNERQRVSIKKALLAFQEDRQELMDSPGETKSIRLNTFKTYKVRIHTLIEFFQQQQVIKKEQKVKTVESLTAADFSDYQHWRERQGIMLTTIKTEITQINTILSWFAGKGYISKLIRLKLPSIDTDKYRQPNRLLTEEEEKILSRTLKRLCSSGDPEKQKRWYLYTYWLEWLQDTFSRPHECRLLRFIDVNEYKIDGKIAVQFYTKPETKTGQRLVYATSSVKGKLLKLYKSWRLSDITSTSHLFLLPKGTPPSSSWYSDMWKKLLAECGFSVKSRELTQYSLRHQGINALLLQGVAPTKVADLAGHSLNIQQKIYKKYKLENDHSVLRVDTKKEKRPIPLNTDAGIPFPWEIDSETGEWFPDES